MKTCTHQNCDRRVYALTLCQMHYQQHNLLQKPQCTKEGCEARQTAQLLCSIHYREYIQSKEPCSFRGCKNTQFCRLFCISHYQQDRKRRNRMQLEQALNPIPEPPIIVNTTELPFRLQCLLNEGRIVQLPANHRTTEFQEFKAYTVPEIINKLAELSIGVRSITIINARRSAHNQIQIEKTASNIFQITYRID